MTNNEIVSRITNGLKSLNKDDRISRRYILNVAQNIATFLISQKLRDKSLFREDNIYTTIECFEMIKKDRFNCDVIEFRSCNKLMRSKEKLPELVYSRYGGSIKEVTSINYTDLSQHGTLFLPSTVSQYRRDRRRELQSDNRKFYIRDGYLYLPDSEVEVVALYVLTVDEYKAKKVSGCSNDDACKSAWDFEFVCPDKLLNVVVQEAIKEVSLQKQVVEDTNPNMDENLKSKTTV